MGSLQSNARSEAIGRLKGQWADYCREQKLNSTQQRELIVEQFLASHGHISIEELLDKVRKRNPKLGYATVYRTMRLLVEAGIAIQRRFGETESRFEVAGEHHDHLICTKCGLILEFEDQEIERLQDEIAQRLGGFLVTRHRHELYGVCGKAQGIAGGICPNEGRNRSNGS